MASSDEDDASYEYENRYEELPSGSERYIIEHYFHKGFTNKQIVLMLGTHHDISICMNAHLSDDYKATALKGAK